MLWLNVSQEACTSVSMQFMNPMTKCTCIYTVELDLLFHHCITTKILFLFLLRLNRRDEQLHHLNNDCKKLNEEVMNLRMELGREKEKCKKLEDSNKHLAEDRDQFKDR